MKAERQITGAQAVPPAVAGRNESGASLPVLPRRRYGWAVLGFLACVALPTAAGGWYWYHVAADRYVSELRYAIRGGAGVERAESAAGSLLTGAAGAGLSDGFILEDYLRSEAALVELAERVPLREMLGRDGGDPIRRYDPALPGAELIDFWNAALEVRFDVLTGITYLGIKLFRPEDSREVAEVLVEMLSALVDRLSEQQQNEMLAYVNGEYVEAERHLRETLDAIEAFRRRTLTVSPTREAELNSATIAQLTSEVTGLRVRLRTLLETVPNSPQIPRLREQIQSLEAQIANTRAAVGGGAAVTGAAGDGALPLQLTDFERLQNEYQIALDSFIATLELQQTAQARATLGRAHLVVFVPPQTARIATAPDRAVEVLKIGLVSLVLWIMARVLLASLRTP
ncbi:MAG: hypothetical protein AAGF76_01745 [Pseudomonadota bacterium]